eukprot:m.271206 g.271206  ORF g.271206 m.271206 type:complete len:64 (-) comp17670_c1_seq8:419-610(-)
MRHIGHQLLRSVVYIKGCDMYTTSSHQELTNTKADHTQNHSGTITYPLIGIDLLEKLIYFLKG